MGPLRHWSSMLLRAALYDQLLKADFNGDGVVDLAL